MSDADLASVALTKPRRFILRMVLFLILVALVIGALISPIIDAFAANPALNGLIAGAFVAGLIYVFRQVSILGREVRWMETYTNDEAEAVDASTKLQPVLLAPMAHMLRDSRTGALHGHLSAVSTRSILDSVAARLDEARDISRYLSGLLIFLGLLGTFWGLLGTIGAVGDTISTLQVGSGDVGTVFEDLKAGLAAPLDGMGTAFSSSLFGLAGSLVLGFLDLQAGGAQNRFYNELEDWLAARTRLSSGGGTVVGDAEGASVPAYVAALLEQTAESLDALQRTLARSEERRVEADRMMGKLGEQIAGMADQSGDDQSRRHLAAIDSHLARLIEQDAQGRNDAVADIRADIKLLTRTIAQTAAQTATQSAAGTGGRSEG